VRTLRDSLLPATGSVLSAWIDVPKNDEAFEVLGLYLNEKGLKVPMVERE
jgi:hypothetical protein